MPSTPTYDAVAAVYREVLRNHPFNALLVSQLRGNVETLLIPVLIASQPATGSSEAVEWLDVLWDWVLEVRERGDFANTCFGTFRRLHAYAKGAGASEVPWQATSLPPASDAEGWAYLLRACADGTEDEAMEAYYRRHPYVKAKSYKDFVEPSVASTPIATVDF